MNKKVKLINTEVEFSCLEGQTILDAALSNGINLDYNCSNGQCGKCQAVLLSGVVNNLEYSYDQELEVGSLLTCCSITQTDLLIDAHYFPQLDGVERMKVPAKVDKLCRINENILVITLRLPVKVDFKFLPGQYINLYHAGETRSYSIANIYGNKIELHIKKVSGGLFSDFLFNKLQEEHLFRFFGPLGTFFLRDNSNRLIFLCTGTGFAPIKSMVESLIKEESKRSIHIFWGARKYNDLYSELPFMWADEFKNISFTPVISGDNEMPYNSVKGYVQDAILSEYIDFTETDVYACGSEMMINDAKELLVSSGLNSESFYSDAFLSSNIIRKEI